MSSIAPVGRLPWHRVRPSPLVTTQRLGAKAARVRTRTLARGLLCGLLLIAMALTYVWSRVRVIQLGYEVTRLKAESAERRAEVERLRVEMATLKSPQRLASIAAGRGMRPPQGTEVVFVERGGKP